MGQKLMLPTFSAFVKRVFDGCQKLFWLFSKALVMVVKNYRNITSDRHQDGVWQRPHKSSCHL